MLLVAKPHLLKNINKSYLFIEINVFVIKCYFFSVMCKFALGTLEIKYRNLKLFQKFNNGPRIPQTSTLYC